MIAELASTLSGNTTQFLFSPGSSLSLWSLLAAFLIAAGFAIARRAEKPTSLRALLRGMFPRHRLAAASTRADVGFTLLAVFGSAALFGWAVLSHVAIADAMSDALGKPCDFGLPMGLAITWMTVALWLAYEFAYWLDHMLCHKIPALWAFHKVHHSAETLSPLTVFRVHPVDSIVFYNIVAIVTGATAGAMHWLVGAGVPPLAVAGTNVLLVASIFTIKHLHHSHVWISWRGRWGQWILSPAHHQIHHSVAPEHHDRNFGETLAVFDWLAGTLHQPQAKREPLRFGVEGIPDPHSARGSLLMPFADALSLLWRRSAAVSGPIPETRPSTPDIRTVPR